MPVLEVEIPEELAQEMKDFPETEWKIFIRRLLRHEVERLVELRKIVSKSKLTESDVKELSEKVDRALAKRFRESLHG